MIQAHSGSRISSPVEHSEGYLARAIEQQTAKLPSDIFLWAAGGSIIASLALQFAGRKNDALFVGQWAPTFLILGLYNKLVKVHGHDRLDNSSGGTTGYSRGVGLGGTGIDMGEGV